MAAALRRAPENKFRGVTQADRARFDTFHSGASAHADGAVKKGVRRGAVRMKEPLTLTEIRELKAEVRSGVDAH
eukprot:10560307-Alexandrium_andersonii.AAC.1